MKTYFLIFIQIFPNLILSKFCSEAESKKKCKEFNLNNQTEEKIISRPIFTGRCCWQEETNKCIFTENINFIDWKINNYDCFSNVEKCFNKGKVGNKKFSECNNIETELPYKCCYVGSGNNHICLPIDVSYKSIFGKTIENLRTNYYDFQGKWEIECYSFYFKFNGFIYFFIFLIMLF